MGKKFDIAGMVSDQSKSTSSRRGESSTPATSRTRTRKPAGKGGSSKGASAATRGTQGKDPRKPAEPAQGSSAPTTTTPAAPTRRGPVDPPEPQGIVGEKRINLPLQTELHRALSQARVDDGVEATIRLRAMIELWRHDERLRKRVDRLATKRATTIQRGRPRKDAS